MPKAFSYVRFSSMSQADGDSLRRQSERTADYCRRHGLTLDEKLTFRDLGVSAFKGKNALTGNLGLFLQAVKSGEVPPDSTLIVESFDRISRQGIDTGYDVVKGILKAGVRIVTLSPEREFDVSATRSLSKGALEIMLILERAAEESETKSKRVGFAWRERKKNAATIIVHANLPTWIKREADRLVLIAEKAAVVKRVFAMIREGLGFCRIANKLNAEKVPVLGKPTFRGEKAVWSPGVVSSLAKRRSVTGEYQPCVGGKDGARKPDGPAFPNYYPPVLTAEEFEAARAVIARRDKCGRGRRSKHVGLFSGLLKDARTGGTLTTSYRGAKYPTTLHPSLTRATTGKPYTTFDLRCFERSLRLKLSEVKVKDIATQSGADFRVELLEARIAENDALAGKWRAKMDNPNLVDAVSAQLEKLTVERRALVADLATAHAESASAVGNSWGRVGQAADLLTAEDNDENRERYRAAVRQAVESIHVLIVPDKNCSLRLAAVQVWFRGGAHRDYLIGYHKGRPRKPAQMLPPRSWADAGLPDRDLRDPKHVKDIDAAICRAVAQQDGTKKRRERVRELTAKGWSLRKIGAELGVHGATVQYDLERMGLWKRKRLAPGDQHERRLKEKAMFEKCKSVRAVADAFAIDYYTCLTDLRAVGSGPPKRKSPTRPPA